MATLTSKYRLELTTIRALNLLFYDYTREDIAALCEHPTFAHTWDAYLGGGTRTVELTEFWDIWSRKWDYETQGFVTDYAMRRYGEEAYRGIDATEALLKAVQRKREED